MRGLYAITDASVFDPDVLSRQVGEVIDGGAVMIQFRHKTTDHGLYQSLAEAVIETCRVSETPCILNDHMRMAHTLGADGAHLGQTDGSLSEARQLLGYQAILGRTCHNSKGLMEEAVRDGASYCAFGRLFESEDKTERTWVIPVPFDRTC